MAAALFTTTAAAEASLLLLLLMLLLMRIDWDVMGWKGITWGAFGWAKVFRGRTKFFWIIIGFVFTWRNTPAGAIWPVKGFVMVVTTAVVGTAVVGVVVLVVLPTVGLGVMGLKVMTREAVINGLWGAFGVFATCAELCRDVFRGWETGLKGIPTEGLALMRCSWRGKRGVFNARLFEAVIRLFGGVCWGRPRSSLTAWPVSSSIVWT